jgi:hypothetical protein
MAKAQVRLERNAEWINVAADDFSPAVQDMLNEERKILAAVKQETPVEKGREITGLGYTRWGQLQMTVQDTVAAKPQAGRNKTLAEYLAERAASGQSS